jgi:hypothetical protein
MPTSSTPSVAKLAAQLQRVLDETLDQNQRLTEQIKEFEARAEEAERRARETQEKLKILESLKTKEYQQVVTELFDAPSRHAARLSLIVALASIAFGLIQSVVFNYLASRDTAASIDRFSVSLREQMQEDIQTALTQTKRDVDVLIHDRLRDGSTISRALKLEDVRVTDTVGANEDRYYEVKVPANSRQLKVELSYNSPSHAHIYVHHDSVKRVVNWKDRSVVTRVQCRNGHRGSPDKCVIDNPMEGRWIVQVRGFLPQGSSPLRSAETVTPTITPVPERVVSGFSMTATVR